MENRYADLSFTLLIINYFSFQKWNNMLDEVEEKLDMKEEDYRKLDVS